MSHITHRQIVHHAAKHALAVVAYVILVILVMTALTSSRANTPDSLLDIFTALMLFTVSAGVMATLVFGKPVMWYVDGKKKEAVALLAWTLGIMAGITGVAVFLLA